jgi:hypothetical protein
MAKTQPALSNSVAGEVINASVVLKDAGDGLSKALTVEPFDIESGDEGYIAIRWTAGAVHFVPVKDAPGCFTRKVDLHAQEGTFLEDEAVEQAIERTKIAIEEHEGVHRLPLEGNGDDAADG